MRVLVCPDKFAGTLTAVQAAEAIAEGWLAAAPADSVLVRPLADGGPGFLQVVEAATKGRLHPVSTVDPLGRPVTGGVLVAGETAYLESAQACGLHLLAPAERDPKVTTSYGLGVLVAAAVEFGVREIVVGLGGSATNDAGAGMLAALGCVPLDAAGYALPYGGAALAYCERLDGVPRLRGARLVGATDVDNPLVGPQGAAAVFGPQKGATPADVALLDAAMARFAEVLERDLPDCPVGLAALPGSGAAGGLGAAILACGGRRISGISVVLTLTDFDTALADADLVITGEGCLDQSSIHGKVVGGVACAARQRGTPCIVLAGRIELEHRDACAAGITAAYSLVDHVGSPEAAMERPAQGLASLAATVARQQHRLVTQP